MADLKVKLEAKARGASKRPKSVGMKTLRTASGATLRVTSLDANSASFGADFLYVFKSNVRKARKGNKVAEGAADGAEAARPAKPGPKIER